MKLKNLLISLFALSWLFTACNPAKHLTKKGDQFRQSGLHEDALHFYKQALNRNMLYLQARTGVQESANAALSKRLERVFRANADGNLKESVEGFLAAVKLRDEMKRYRVELDIPSFYFTQFETDKSNYLEQLYNEGIDLMEQNRFDAAKAKFDEIRKIDTNYRDINNLSNISLLSPKYEQGKKFFEVGEYRKAYYLFKEIFDVDPRFKETRKYLDESQNNATLTIAVMGFQSSDNNTRTLAQNIQGMVVSALANAKDPFIKVVDRENTDKLLQEQRLSLSGITNQNTAVKAGELLGVKAVIIGRVLNYDASQGRLTKQTKQGYESYFERVFDVQTGATNLVARYRKVNYQQFEGLSVVAAKVQYQLVSTETGQILASQTIDHKLDDAVAFVTFEGDPKNLFAGVWRNRLFPDPNDRVFNSSRDKRELNNLINGRRDFVPFNQLQSDLQNEIAKRIVSGILKVDFNGRK